MADNPATDATRIAVEFLTLWIESDRVGAATHITEVLHGPEAVDPNHVIAGLLNLSMFLAFELAKKSGTEAEDYKSWVRSYLQNLSAQLPEGR